MNNYKNKYKERRRIIIVDKSFQFRYFLRILLASILISFFLVMLTYWWNINYAKQILIQLEIYEENLQALVFKELIFSIFSLVLIILAISFLFGIYILFISHKSAGPIFRLKKYMKMVEDGFYNLNMVFRKKDELKEIAIDFNNMISSILNREKEEIKKIKDLEMRLNSLITESENIAISREYRDVKMDIEQLRKRKESRIEERAV